jgi:hypothetical protein
MDVVMIFNGLGNQMSQYAFYLRKKEINPSTIFIYNKGTRNQHNGYELERAFNIGYKFRALDYLLYYIYQILFLEQYFLVLKPLVKVLNTFGIRLIKESYNYDYNESDFISRKGLNFYWGGWHSEKNFLSVKDEVLNAFTFRLDNIEDGTNFSELISEIKKTNSISIHVRRGDFLTSGGIYQFANVCTLSYYQKAIELIVKEVENPHFYVFSNDLEWCKSNLSLDVVTFVDCNKGVDSWRDMQLMSLCKYNINANSSFSWWGAWLNKNDNKIIVPEDFINNMVTKDVYPENWIKIRKNNV